MSAIYRAAAPKPKRSASAISMLLPLSASSRRSDGPSAQAAFRSGNRCFACARRTARTDRRRRDAAARRAGNRWGSTRRRAARLLPRGCRAGRETRSARRCPYPRTVPRQHRARLRWPDRCLSTKLPDFFTRLSSRRKLPVADPVAGSAIPRQPASSRAYHLTNVPDADPWRPHKSACGLPEWRHPRRDAADPV